MTELDMDFRRHLREHKYELIEEDWLALLAEDYPVNRMMELAELAARYAPASIAVTLLKVLADWLGEKDEHRLMLAILRRLVEIADDDPELPVALADCFRLIYADVGELLERLLQRAGLGFGEKLADALAAFDGYRKLLPGGVVIVPESGPARVKSLDLLLNRVVFVEADDRDFELDLDAAVSRTRPAEPDGYYELLMNEPAVLRARAGEEPGRVVRELLRDLRQPVFVQAIRRELAEVVADDDWESFWNRARRELDNDPHVRSVVRPSRGYVWSDRPVEKKSGRSAGARSCSSGPSAERLAGQSRKELVEDYERQKTVADRRRFADLVVTARPADAAEALADIFCSSRDNRIFGIIEQRLAAFSDEAWPKLLNRVLTSYRQFPDAFIWAARQYAESDEASAKRFTGLEPRAVLSRLLDLVESPDFRKKAAAIRKALVANDYRLVAASLDAFDNESAGRLLNRLGRVVGIEEYRQADIAALVYARFPELESLTDDNVILTTEEGFARARSELAKLTGEELPRAAEELAVARAHGDLSENYEYKAAKEKQARLMGQVQRLQAGLSRARVFEAGDIDCSRVSFGCRVHIEDDSGRPEDYVLLGPWDSDPDRGVISYLAPLSEAMLGRRAGDSFEHDGRPYTIKKISRA